MKVELVAEPLKVKYVPNEEDLSRCFDLGVNIAKKLQGGGKKSRINEALEGYQLRSLSCDFGIG